MRSLASSGSVTRECVGDEHSAVEDVAREDVSDHACGPATTETPGGSGRETSECFERLTPNRRGVVAEGAIDGPRGVATPIRSRAGWVAQPLPYRGQRHLHRESLQFSRTMAEALLHE